LHFLQDLFLLLAVVFINPATIKSEFPAATTILPGAGAVPFAVAEIALPSKDAIAPLGENSAITVSDNEFTPVNDTEFAPVLLQFKTYHN
jgi:hypothetical protein